MFNNTTNQGTVNNSSRDLTLVHETDKMSSLEVASATGKQHAHIMRDIRNLLEQGVSESNFGLSSYKQLQPNGGFKEIPCYQLTYKGCLILASGYNALLREKIINRWEELETGKAQPISKQKEKNNAYDKDVISYRTMRAKAALTRANEAKAKLLLKIAESEKGTTFEKVCKTYAVNTLCGGNVIELPSAKGKTYSADEIAKQLGTNKNVIGRLASKNNLKTDDNGIWVHDKSPYSSKEVTSFRYYEKAIDIFRKLLASEVA